MGSGQLILLVRPRLLHSGKRGPRIRVLADAHLSGGGGPGCERLIEPQVIPPLHSHQIAEPHVRHLVQDRVVTTLKAVRRRLRGEDVLIAVRHSTHVLHRAHVVLRAENLVVLITKRVGAAEIGVVEVEAVLRLTEQALRIHMRDQAGARVQPKLDRALLTVVTGARVGVRDALVLASHNRNQVGGQRVINCGGPRLGAVAVVGDLHCLVEHHGVRLRCGHRNVVGGLQIRLVKTGEHLHRHRRLELGVQVVLAIHRVGELVQALTGAVVGDGGVDGELVRAVYKHKLITVGRGAVEGCLELIRHQVKVGLTCLGVKRDHRAGGELLLAGHIHVDVVVDVINQCFTRLRIIAREICFHRRHATEHRYSGPHEPYKSYLLFRCFLPFCLADLPLDEGSGKGPRC